jgi:ResB-like family
MKRALERTMAIVSSLKLSVVLLILLAILTWLGTLEQVDSGLYDVQRRYFDSLFLVHDAWGIPVPLPGARLVMIVLFVNLALGGILRLRRGWRTAGVLIAHLGIVFLLAAGLVKAWYSVEGRVSLYEGEQANTFQSYHRWEIALLEQQADGQVREFTIPEEAFTRANPARIARFASPDIPFELEVTRFLPNCRVRPKDQTVEGSLPVIDEFLLDARPLERENEQNRAGAYVTLIDRQTSTRSDGLLHGLATQPMPANFGGRNWAVELRREQHPLPFTLELQKFTKQDHPNMEMAKAFSSDVRVTQGTSMRPVKISMNEPLREGGLVLYQSSWGPANAPPGTPVFSTLSVVQNPADQFPLYACIVIALGLALHYSRKLVRHIRAEARAT